MESVSRQTKVGPERIKGKLVPKTAVTKATTRGRDTILKLWHADDTTETLMRRLTCRCDKGSVEGLEQFTQFI
ncbi:hypothetical protein E5D57_010773 [Metarhizium anisopliae]|nr:hypothetical protein E5D57_010773 [Metarhizium anisopliae]